MNLHARRSKPSELLLLRFGGVERTSEREIRRVRQRQRERLVGEKDRAY